MVLSPPVELIPPARCFCHSLSLPHIETVNEFGIHTKWLGNTGLRDLDLRDLGKLLDFSELVSCLSNGLFHEFNEITYAKVTGNVG